MGWFAHGRLSLLVVAVFLLVSLGEPLYRPVENWFYDYCLAFTQDTVLAEKRLHPSIRLIGYQEETERQLGEWNPQRSRELIETLLGFGAAAVAIHPAVVEKLIPDKLPSDRAYVVDPKRRNEPNEKLYLPLDPDGICRYAGLAWFSGDGRPQPTVPLQLLARLLDTSRIEFGPNQIQVGSRTIATDSKYRVRIRFRRSEERMGATILLKDEDDDTGTQDLLVPIFLEQLFGKNRSEMLYNYLAKQSRGQVFLIGAAMKQARQETLTPLGALQDYKVHACLLDTLLSHWRLVEPNLWQRVLLNLLATVIFAGLFLRQSSLWIAVVWAAAQVSMVALLRSLFTAGVYVHYTPLFLISSLLAGLIAYRQQMEAHEALRRFGGQGALEAGFRGDESVLTEVREKTASIVFTNVLDYLKELERYGSPDVFFERRQQYAQYMADTFRKHGGVVLDYQGDFQMIGFNVELRADDPDHALHAVRACQEFLAGLHIVTDPWWEVGKEELGPAHCGICTGPVAVGHVGSQRQAGGRLAQAAIGDTSNVAARLLGAARKLNTPILMARTTYEAGGGKFEVEHLDPIPLKGKTEPVPICRPMT